MKLYVPFDAVATENFLPVRVFAAVTVTPGSGVFPERTVPLISNEFGWASAAAVVSCGDVLVAGAPAACGLEAGAGAEGL